MVAIALHESGGRCRNTTNPDGPPVAGAQSCSVGPFQIYCPACVPGCVRRFLDLDAAAQSAARRLSRGRSGCLAGIAARRRVPWYCAVRPYGWAAKYNPNSHTWLHNVLRKYRQLKRWKYKNKQVKI
jgi:hypothetical protein